MGSKEFVYQVKHVAFLGLDNILYANGNILIQASLFFLVAKNFFCDGESALLQHPYQKLASGLSPFQM